MGLTALVASLARQHSLPKMRGCFFLSLCHLTQQCAIQMKNSLKIAITGQSPEPRPPSRTAAEVSHCVGRMPPAFIEAQPMDYSESCIKQLQREV